MYNIGRSYRALGIGLFFLTAYLSAGTAHGQLLPVDPLGGEGGENALDVSLVTGDTCRITDHVAEILSKHEDEIESNSERIGRMKKQKLRYSKRLDEVRKRLDELESLSGQGSESSDRRVSEKGNAVDAGAGDSAGRAVLDVRIETLDNLARLLKSAISLIENIDQVLNEERRALSLEFDKSDLLNAKCEEEKPQRKDEDKGPTSLSLARSVSHELYLAKLDLSLARSRQRSFSTGRNVQQTQAQSGESGLNAYPDQKEYVEAVKEADFGRIEEEASSIEARIRQLKKEKARWKGLKWRTRDIVSKLDVLLKEKRIDELEDRFESIVSRIVVDEEDLAEQKKLAEKKQAQLDERIKNLKQERSDLLHESVEGRSPDGEIFSYSHVTELEQIELRENIQLLEMKKAGARFVVGAYRTLYRLNKGLPPGQEFLDAHDDILDEGSHQKRISEVSRRHEAWRRQRSQIAKKEVAPGKQEIKQRVLDLIGQIKGHCEEQESVLESDGRLASIVRFQLSRYHVESRGFLWYLARTALTLMFLAAAIVLSVLLSRWMLTFSRKAMNFIHTRLHGSGRAFIRAMSGSLRKVARYAIFILYVVGIVGLWVSAAVLSLNIVWELDLVLEQLPAVLSSSLFMIGETSITPADILKLTAILVLTVIGTRLLQAFMRHQVFHFFDWDEGVKHAVAVVLRYIILLIGFSLGLEYIGLGLEMFAVFIGVIGIGIGFGLQKIAANLVSGFVILFSRPVKKGDFITVADNLEGQILDVGIRTTKVKTRDNIVVILPNKDIISDKVINWSYGDTRIRLRVPVSVAYGSDVDEVERVLLSVAREHPDVLEAPQPRVWFSKFGESSLDFELLIWTSDIRKRYTTISDLNRQIDAGFRRNSITIPFPQRDIHIRDTVGNMKPE